MSSGVTGDQPAQWALARAGQDPGSACAILLNRPGAYRLSSVAGSPAAWALQYRESFPEPGGGAPAGCLPSPVLTPALAAALGDPAQPGLFSLERLGSVLPDGTVVGGPPVVGRATTLTVRLPGGADPLGIAARLVAAGGTAAAAPATFWPAARPTLLVSGDVVPPAGVPFVQAADGTWEAPLTLSPTASGPIRLRLEIAGGAVRNALGPPSDLFVSLFPWLVADQGLGPTVTRVVRDPLNWRLQIPLGTAADPLAPALTAVVQPPTVLLLTPAQATAGEPDLTLAVAGTDFAAGAVLRWNDADRVTTVVNANGLAALIPAADIAPPAPPAITVANPDGGVSARSPSRSCRRPGAGAGGRCRCSSRDRHRRRGPALLQRRLGQPAAVLHPRLAALWARDPAPDRDELPDRAGRPRHRRGLPRHRVERRRRRRGRAPAGACPARPARTLGRAVRGRPLAVTVRANQPVPGALVAVQQRFGSRSPRSRPPPCAAGNGSSARACGCPPARRRGSRCAR